MDSKSIFKSKTFYFNLLLGLFALAEKTVADVGVSDGILVTILSVGNLILRGVTKTAVTVKA